VNDTASAAAASAAAAACWVAATEAVATAATVALVVKPTLKVHGACSSVRVCACQLLFVHLGCSTVMQHNSL
jgi:hypothetical protein